MLEVKQESDDEIRQMMRNDRQEWTEQDLRIRSKQNKVDTICQEV